jgi:hypothetical protein
MSWRFRRTVRLFPGCHIHIGKRGLGLSFGLRGFHFGLHAVTGRPYVSAGLPGTGFYWYQNLGGGHQMKGGVPMGRPVPKPPTHLKL